MSEEPETNGMPEGSRPPLAGWLNRNVFGMAFTSLLSDAGHEMATAVLPGFLAVLGVPAFFLGLIEGVSDAVASFVKLGAGWWSDRIGHRKAIATAGYALTGGAKAIFALALGWPLILFGRVLAWFGRGIRGPLRDAMLAESVAERDRGKAFGFHRAGDTLGAIIGPLLGALFLFLLGPLAGEDPAWPFRTIFLITLIPGLGAAIAFAWLVRETVRPPNHEMKFWASLALLPGGFRRFLVGVGVFGAGDFSHTLLILAATQMLAREHGAVQATQLAALLYALRNVTYAVASYPLGMMSDRVGRRVLLWLGYLLGALVMLGFAALFSSEAAGPELTIFLVGLFAFAGIYIAAEDTLEGAMTADLVPDLAIRGMAYGVVGTVNGVGDLVSSLLVGALWAVHPTIGFAYAAVMMLLGALLLYRVR